MVSSKSLGLLLIAALMMTQLAKADDLSDALVFYASFDSEQADLAPGDGQLLTAKTIQREKIVPGLPEYAEIVSGGRWGRCLRFTDVSEEIVLFRGEGNVPYGDAPMEMTISFWLRVDPENGLKPGYVDPLQITDKKWNDASLFVDFTKDDQPRHFRLGVFSDFQHWNPTQKKWEDVAEKDRPMVVQRKTPFGGDRWTHVVVTLSEINSGRPDGRACLYVDGKRVGCLQRDLRITWDMKKVAVMLGIQYIGEIDDLAIFNRALAESTVQQLNSLDGGVGALLKTK